MRHAATAAKPAIEVEDPERWQRKPQVASSRLYSPKTEWLEALGDSMRGRNLLEMGTLQTVPAAES